MLSLIYRFGRGSSKENDAIKGSENFFVGKYVDLKDAYFSLIEALDHAASVMTLEST